MEANIMGSLPIGRLLRKMSMPLIFSMLVQVLCVFSFAALHQIIMERLLSAIGRADLTMIPMLTGAVVNIILDPVMIFGWLGCPAMGIAGAGIATVTALAPGIYVIFIRLQSFVVMPSSGMSNAGISIIAYNYGAREKRRIMDTLWVSLRVNLVIAAALVLTTSTQILSGFLQALGQGTASFVVAISQAAFLLLSAWLLSLTGSAVLVWLAFPIMEVLRFVIAAMMVGHTYQGKLAVLQPQAA